MPGFIFEISAPEARRVLLDLARFQARSGRHLGPAQWQVLERTAREHGVPTCELESILDELGLSRPTPARPVDPTVSAEAPRRPAFVQDASPTSTGPAAPRPDRAEPSTQPVEALAPRPVRALRTWVEEVLDAMVHVAAGPFQMGSPANENGRFENEGPQHRVFVTRALLVHPLPVTQQLWQQVMGFNPAGFKGDLLPVESVSWYDCVAFCNALSRHAGLTPAYDLVGVQGEPGGAGYRADVGWRGPSGSGFRLLTEAEWELAARGGVSAVPDPVRTFVPHRQWLGEVAWYQENSGGSTHPVGRRRPLHGLGLRDMLGNVGEWVWDVYEPYPAIPLPTGGVSPVDRVDPTGGMENERSTRCVRGGSWAASARTVREAFRGALPPERRDRTIGFRFARSV